MSRAAARVGLSTSRDESSTGGELDGAELGGAAGIQLDGIDFWDPKILTYFDFLTFLDYRILENHEMARNH